MYFNEWRNKDIIIIIIIIIIIKLSVRFIPKIIQKVASASFFISICN